MKEFNIDKPIVKNIKYRIVKTKELQDGVIIYLDNKDKIHLSVDSYFENAINKQIGLDDKLYEKLKNEERLYLAYRGVLRKLSSKDYTIKQIKDYLYIKKELHKNEVDEIINRLCNYGLLDDDKYCFNRTNYLNRQLLSVKQIKIKLSNEGISKDLIDKYVINNSEDEYAKVNKLVSKYSNSIKNKSTLAIKQNILNKLVNAGYSYDICKETIEKLNIRNDCELDLLKKENVKANKKYSKKYDDYELRSHIYAYLINKGFKSEDIKKVIGG